MNAKKKTYLQEVNSTMRLFINIFRKPMNKELVNKNLSMLLSFRIIVVKRLSKWFKGKLSVLIPALVIIVFSWFIFNLQLNIDASQIYHLLTTISTSLAAILAIILSASLVTTQLVSRYSSRLLRGLFLKSSVIFYLFVFIVGIIFPLTIFVMDPEYYPILIRFSLILVVICLAFLIPYLIFLSEWLRPKNIIYELYRKSSKKLREDRNRLPGEIFTIHEIATSLWEARNYEGFRKAIEALTATIIDIASYLEKTEANEVKVTDKQNAVKARTPLILSQLLRELRQLGVLVKDDPIASNRLVGELAKGAIEIETLNISKDKKDAINEEMLDEMWETAKRIATKEDEVTFERFAFLVSGLGGNALASAGMTTTKRILDCLRRMFSISISKGWAKAARQVTISIHSMGKIALDKTEEFGELESKGKEVIRILQICFSKAVSKCLNLTDKNKIYFDRAYEVNYRMNDLARRAQEKNLEDVVKAAIVSIGKNAKKLIKIQAQKPEMMLEKFTSEIIGFLLWFTGKLAENFSNEVTETALEELTAICSDVINVNQDLAKKIIPGITTTIGEKAVRKKESILLEHTINKLVALAVEIQAKDTFLTILIGAQIWKLGGYAEEVFPQGRESIKDGLTNLEKLIGRSGLEEGFNKVKEWSSPPSHLDEFKKFFEIS